VEKNVISFKMVIDKDIFPQKWESFFKEGFRKILEHSLGDQSEDTIFNELWMGKLFMKIAITPKGYAGFYTGRMSKVPTGSTLLDVCHAYIVPGQPPEVLDEMLKDIDKMAIELKCDYIKFGTTREHGFEKKLQDVGWHKGYVTLYKEVQHNG
jgi:hypothetical protein